MTTAIERALYRGRRVNNGELVYGGFYISSIGIPVIAVNFSITQSIEVAPATVCQWIGIVDKNGDKIFEGDQVACHKNGIIYDSHVRDFVKFGVTKMVAGYCGSHNIDFNIFGPYVDDEYLYGEMLSGNVILTGRNINDSEATL